MRQVGRDVAADLIGSLSAMPEPNILIPPLAVPGVDEETPSELTEPEEEEEESRACKPAVAPGGGVDSDSDVDEDWGME